MDDKMLFELVRLVNTPGWTNFVKYLEEKQTESISEVLNQKGEDTIRGLGKLKVYGELINLQKVITSRYEEQQNG